MGKLVLTRRAGESVKLVEANGDTWNVKVMFTGEGQWLGKARMRLEHPDCLRVFTLSCGESCTFAGGSLELRPTKRHWPDQAVLAFDFPQDVKIVRTEIA